MAEFGQPIDAGAGEPDLTALLSSKRKRALAQALLEQVVNRPVETYRRNPLAAGLDFLTARGSQKKMDALDQEEAGIARQVKASEKAQLAEMLSSFNSTSRPQAGPPMEGATSLPDLVTPGNPRNALMKGMASSSPNVSKLAGTLFKNQSDTYQNVLTATKGQVTPQSVISSSQSQNPAGIIPRTFAEPSMMTLPGLEGKPGITGVRTEDGNGSVNFTPPPVGQTINVGSSAETHVATEQLKTISGLSDVAQGAQGNLNRVGRAFEMISAGAKTGGGGAIGQSARKVAEFFGIKNAATAPTEALMMQLGETLLENAKKLAPVTGTDITVLQSILGSLNTNPQAMTQALNYLAADSVKAIEILDRRIGQARIPAGVKEGLYDGFRVQKPKVDRLPQETQDTILRELEMGGFDPAPYRKNPAMPPGLPTMQGPPAQPARNINGVPRGVRFE